MGMRIVEGRPFHETDGPDAPRVAIVNEALAKRYYAGRNTVGGALQFAGSTNKPLQIVGIVADTRTDDLSEPASPRSTCRSGSPAHSRSTWSFAPPAIRRRCGARA